MWIEIRRCFRYRGRLAGLVICTGGQPFQTGQLWLASLSWEAFLVASELTCGLKEPDETAADLFR